MKISIRRSLPAVAGLVLSTAGNARACAMCMGGPDSNNGPALNGAIFLMLGMLGCVFAGIGAVAFSFWRRRHQAPLQEQPPFATGGF
jgi:hypothetical protein